MTVLLPRSEDDDQAPTILAVCWTLTAFATLVVLTRLYIRQWVLLNPGVDDWLIAVSMVLHSIPYTDRIDPIYTYAVTLHISTFTLTGPKILGLLFCAIATVSVSYGYGKHTTALSIHDAEKALFYNVIAFIVGIVSFALPKLAVAALLCRLMNPTMLQRCIIWGLTGMVAAVAVVNILIYVTMCDPPPALWKISMVMEKKATCRSIWILIDYATFNGGRSLFSMYSLYASTDKRVLKAIQHSPPSWTSTWPSTPASSSTSCRCPSGRRSR